MVQTESPQQIQSSLHEIAPDRRHRAQDETNLVRGEGRGLGSGVVLAGLKAGIAISPEEEEAKADAACKGALAGFKAATAKRNPVTSL